MPDTSERDGGGAELPSRTLRRWAPAMVGLLGLAGTFAATFQIALLIDAKDERRFETWVEKTHSIGQERIRYRLTRFDSLTAGLIDHQHGASDPRFDRQVRQVLQHDRSIRGIGLAVEAPTDPADTIDTSVRDAIHAPIQAEDAPDPAPDAEPVLVLQTRYFRGASRADERALSELDITADPILRAAMARALSLDEPVASPVANLTGGRGGSESNSSAIVLLIPTRPADEASPSAAAPPPARGCLYAVLDTERFWQAVFPYSEADRLRVAVYDGDAGSDAPLWVQQSGVRVAPRSQFRDTRPLTAAGHTFTLGFETLPEFDHGSLWELAVGGTLIVGLLVTAGLFLLSRAQARAWQAADRAAAKLRASQRQLEEVNQTLERRVARRTAVAEHRAAQLQRLARQLTRAEQDERRRLARVLHDHLQQVLVAARIQVRLMDGDGCAADESPPTTQLDALLQEALDTCRSLTVELSPPVLHTSGLVPALEWLAHQTQRKYRVHVDLRAEPPGEWDGGRADDGIDLDIRVFLFQAVRELLFNAAKYARADRVSVHVTRLPDQRVRVAVEDQGAGFDPAITAEEREVGGFGLFSIRERAQLLGGAMHLHSAPGRGTHVVLTVPSRKPPRPRRATVPPAPAHHDAEPAAPPLHPAAMRQAG